MAHYLHVGFFVMTAQGPDLLNVLRQFYDNAKVKVDLRWTSNLQNILQLS